MVCHLVVLDRRSGVRPTGIGETLRRALAKIVMRASGGQAKIACRNIQLCAGLKAVIEGATHTMGQKRLVRVKEIRQEGKEAGGSNEEEESGGGGG